MLYDWYYLLILLVIIEVVITHRWLLKFNTIQMHKALDEEHSAMRMVLGDVMDGGGDGDDSNDVLALGGGLAALNKRNSTRAPAGSPKKDTDSDSDSGDDSKPAPQTTGNKGKPNALSVEMDVLNALKDATGTTHKKEASDKFMQMLKRCHRVDMITFIAETLAITLGTIIITLIAANA